jgi:uncharacterized pyridoxamine 5'-phosphate oxidase family protein
MSQGILREKVYFVAEREDRCYEASHELEGLEDAYLKAVEQRATENVAFDNEPPLMEIWSRDKIEGFVEGGEDG